MSETERIRAELEFGGVESVKKVTEAERELTQEVKKGSEAFEGHEISAHHAHRGLHQMTLGLDEVLHSSKDVGEILERTSNHLAMSAISFGASGPMFIGLMGLSTALSLVATNWRTIMGAFQDMHAIPEAATAVHRLTDELEKNKAKLDELKKAQTLTNTELKEFKTLTEEQAALEKRIEGEKALAGKSGAAMAPGGNITKAIQQFGGGAVRKAIEDAMVSQGGDFGPEANRQLVNQLVAGVQGGDAGATQYLQDIMRHRGGGVAAAIRGEPGGMTAADKALAEAKQKAYEKDVKGKLEHETELEKHMEGMTRGIELGHQQGTARSMSLAREVSKAFADQQKARAERERSLLGSVGQGDAQIAALLARSNEFVQLAANGQTTQGEAQAQIARIQMQVHQIMAEQKRQLSQWNRMRLQDQNRTQQNMGGN